MRVRARIRIRVFGRGRNVAAGGHWAVGYCRAVNKNTAADANSSAAQKHEKLIVFQHTLNA